MRINSRLIAVIAGIAAAGVFFFFYSNIIGYIIGAWVLSMLGQPIMKFYLKHLRIRKFQAGPNLCALLTLVTFFLIIGSLLALFVPLIVKQANNLSHVDYQAIGRALEEPLGQFNNYLESRGLIEHQPPPEEQMKNILQLQDWFKPAKISNLFSTILSAASSIILGITSMVFIAFFFLKEQQMFGEFVVTLLPSQHEDKVRRALDHIRYMLSRYFAGILTQMVTIALLASLALSLLGIKNAFLIGAFAALLNVIPYIGPIIGAVFGILITISSNLDLDFYSQMLPMLVKVALVFWGIQLLDNFILSPYIFSTSVMAHPLEIFIVVLMGAQTGGLLGMVLAIPLYTVLRVIAREFWGEFRVVKKLTDEMDEAEGET